MTSKVKRRSLLAAIAGSTTFRSGAVFSQSAPPLITADFTLLEVTDVAPIYVGEEAGIFRKQGFELRTFFGTTRASVSAGVTRGERMVGFGTVLGLLEDRGRGVPIKIIAAGSSSTGGPGSDIVMIHAGSKSGIKSARDLEGKTVSVNGFSEMQMLGRAAVKADGGDPGKVKFTIRSTADGLAALRAGEVDGLVAVEPFGTAAIRAGFPAIALPYRLLSERPVMTTAYYTSETQLKEKPELFAKLRAAINESLDYAQRNPEKVRARIPRLTRVAPDVAAGLLLPRFGTSVPRESVEVLAKAGREFGLLSKPVSYDDAVWEAARAK